MDNELVKPSDILLVQQKKKVTNSLRSAATLIARKRPISLGNLLSLKREIDYAIGAVIEEMFLLERDKEAYRHNLFVSKKNNR
jgi:ribosome biogenesis protein Nip4